ncbi:MAG TPA: hypothetical protein VGP93_12445, partial [Polyangiaceae bacterium]|nr:hypothetical protein [Polyangiaceae bacterium]
MAKHPVRLLLVLVATLILLVACYGHGSRSDSGSIAVVVHDQRGIAVADAVVTTQPPTRSLNTDGSGSALIGRVKPGAYLVLASDDTGAMASADTTVESGATAEVTLTLNHEVGAGGAGGSGGSGTGGFGGVAGGSQGGFSGGGQGGASGGEGGAGPTDEYIDVATQVEAMLVDPVRPYLYAIDRVNNNFLFINLDSRTVEKTIFVGSSPVDLDIDDAASEVFVANFGSTGISVVDLSTQDIGRTMFVDTTQGTWDGNPYRLALTAEGTLAYTSEDQWQDVKLVSSTDGAFVLATGTLFQPDLVASPDGTKLYVAESGLSSIALHRFDVTATTLTEVDTSNSVSAYGSRSVVMSGDGTYVYFAG